MNERAIESFAAVGTATGALSLISEVADVVRLGSAVATIVCALNILIVWGIKVYHAIKKLREGETTVEQAIDEINDATKEVTQNGKEDK